MVKINSSQCTSAAITSNEIPLIKNFIKQNYGDYPIIDRIEGIVLTYKNSIVGCAIFSSPRLQKDKELYSREMLCLCFKRDVEIVKGVQVLIDSYITVYAPFDFFTSQKFQENILEELFTCNIVKSNNVLEWLRPDCSWSTYKITATDSDKYYYGVHHIDKPGLTKRDFELMDSYMGSGGTKFVNWKRKHKNTLKRTIVNIHSRMSDAFFEEKELIGDKYKTDKGHCLNCQPGGILTSVAGAKKVVSIKNCPIHGSVKFINHTCYTCMVQNSFYIDFCRVHGETKFRGGKCCKCIEAKKHTMEMCEIHGKTLFQSGYCRKCVAENSVSIQKCIVHGKTRFIGNKCYKCISIKRFYTDTCKIHGEAKFQNGLCCKCMNIGRITQGFCQKHGGVNLKDGICCMCNSLKSREMKVCPVHGLTKFKGDSCYKCVSAKSFHDSFCDIHGKTKFKGKTCIRCSNNKRYSQKECSIHGLTKHNGNSCCQCIAEKGAISQRKTRKRNS